MKESEFSQLVVKKLREMGYFIQRIESGLMSRGIPDIYFAHKGNGGWIELKVAHEKFDGTCRGINWRQGQQAWAYAHAQHNPRVYTLVHYDDCMVLIQMKKVFESPDTIISNFIRMESFDEFTKAF